MLSSSNKKYSILRFSKSEQRQQFSCGVASLDDYLHSRAGQDNRRHLSVTYILNDNTLNKPAGYYTLSSTSIELIDLTKEHQQKLPKYPSLPTTLIGRLAIDLSYQKQGLGEILLLDALNRAYQASQEVASFAVIVDTLDNHASKFYKKYNFLPLLSNNTRLYLPMKSISKIAKS